MPRRTPPQPDATIRTGISQPYWYQPTGNCFQKAKFGIGRARQPEGATAWFDLLLEGGLVVPGGAGHDERALTLLLTGPPGTGKSTFALEFAYRLAQPASPGAGEGLSSLFITSETTVRRIHSKGTSFHWPDANRVFVSLSSVPNDRMDAPVVTVWEMQRAELTCPDYASTFIRVIVDSVATRLMNMDRLELEEVRATLEDARGPEELRTEVRLRDPYMVVVDSLNALPSQNRAEIFAQYLALARPRVRSRDSSSVGPRILLVVLDSGPDDQQGSFWEYVSDVVIRFDRTYEADYMVRTVEIKKARHQAHVWGIHQLKLYGGTGEPMSQRSQELRRLHPFRSQGGVFIYPSIHFYLSSYKRADPVSKPTFLPTPFEGLNRLLGAGRAGGLPLGRCTAFMGPRGGHKSHFAYYQLLKTVLGDRDRPPEDGHQVPVSYGGILVSLRDDEGLAFRTMQGIVEREMNESAGTVANLQEEGRLEILYYPPGYITPEEFYHRLYLSLQRMKATFPDQRLMLVFNSLDQLASRFPLCARQEIFVPGIIETLTAEEVTSIFVAVDEPGQPEEQYGLLSMADLILRFRLERLEIGDYMDSLYEHVAHLRLAGPDELDRVRSKFAEYHDTVVTRIIRHAGGQPAGGAGVLELVDDGSDVMHAYGREGLHFTPLKIGTKTSKTSTPGAGR